MGDRLATINMSRKRRAAVPLPGELGPHLTQCGLGRGLSPYQVASWSIQPFGHYIGRKLGAIPLLGGELGPHLTQCRLGRAYLHTKWYLDPSSRLATIDMGPKVRGCCAPFWGSWVPISHNVASAKAYLRTKWHLDPPSRLATTDMGWKFGGCVPLGGGAGFSSNAMWPGLRHTFILSGILIHPTVWP